MKYFIQIIASFSALVLVATSGAAHLLGNPATIEEMPAGMLFGQSSAMFDDPLPVCTGCSFSILVDKEDQRFQNACWVANNHNPFREYEYTCKRYACANGKFYYARQAESEDACAGIEILESCPKNSCAPAE